MDVKLNEVCAHQVLVSKLEDRLTKMEVRLATAERKLAEEEGYINSSRLLTKREDLSGRSNPQTGALPNASSSGS